MPKLIEHRETEYDFALTYTTSEAPRVGDQIESPARDDYGIHHFRGTALVVAVQQFINETIAYVEIYEPII